MEPTIWDASGTQRDWAWLHAKYGRLEHRRAAGYPRFALVRIEETSGPPILKVKLVDTVGAPIGALVALTYPDLSAPASYLQDLTRGNPALSPWSTRGIVQFTDGATGVTGFGLGGDSWIRDFAAGGPYHVWPFHSEVYSDCLSWIGWLGGTDHAGPCALTFQLVPIAPEPLPETDFEAVVLKNLEQILVLLNDCAVKLWGKGTQAG